MRITIAPSNVIFVDSLPTPSASMPWVSVKSTGKLYHRENNVYKEVSPYGKGCPKYNGTFLSPAYLEFSEIASPAPISWSIGMKVYYPRTGLVYTLYSIPQPIRQSSNNTAGDAFVYKNVQFFAATKQLDLAPFRDIVPNDNNIHYSTMPTIFTFENVSGIAARLQANMDHYAGENKWTIRVVTATGDLADKLATAKDFSVSNVSCLEVLRQIYETWQGIGWVHTYDSVNNKDVITIGAPNVRTADNTSNQFVYGRGNGLKVLTTTDSQQSDLTTRLYAYGNTKNLISRYYNNVLYGLVRKPILDNESVFIPNLMLPLSDWGASVDREGHTRKDAKKAFIENTSSTATYGLRCKTLYFDGTDGLDDIYPTIEGITAKNIRDAMSASDKYYPSTTIYSDTTRMDQVKSVVNPTDDGVASFDGGKYTEVIAVNESAISAEHFTIPAMKIGQETMVTIFSSDETTEGFTTSANRCKLISDLNLEVQFVGALSSCPLTVKNNKAYVDIFAGGKQVESVEVKGTMNTSLARFQLILSEMDFYVSASAQKMSFRIRVTLVALENIATESSSNFVDAAASKTQYCRKEASNIPADFSITLKQIGFNINDRMGSLTDGLCTLNMKSGYNGGRSFTIKKCAYNQSTDDWSLTCGRTLDESLNEYFPNCNSQIAVGDLFVLTDLEMPEIYVTSAMTRLHNAASAWLSSHCSPKVTYTPEIDSKFMQDQLVAGTLVPLHEGMYFNILDTDITAGTAQYILIDSLTIDEGEELPKYSVTLSDDKYFGGVSTLKKEMKAQRTKTRVEALKKSRQYNVPSEQESVPSATIETNKEFFNSMDETEQNTIIAQCSSGVAAKTYQWKYWNGSAYVNISGATNEAYAVSPTSSAFQGATARLVCEVKYDDNAGTERAVTTSEINLTRPSGGAGVTDYNNLRNKPSINGVELSGNKTSANLGVYSKPADGIPSTDMTAAVQTSLAKADSALQSHQTLKTINNQSLIGSGNIDISASDVFIVIVSETTVGGSIVMTANKTPEQIVNAHESGKACVAMYDSMQMQLFLAQSDEGSYDVFFSDIEQYEAGESLIYGLHGNTSEGATSWDIIEQRIPTANNQGSAGMYLRYMQGHIIQWAKPDYFIAHYFPTQGEKTSVNAINNANNNGRFCVLMTENYGHLVMSYRDNDPEHSNFPRYNFTGVVGGNIVTISCVEGATFEPDIWTETIRPIVQGKSKDSIASSYFVNANRGTPYFPLSGGREISTSSLFLSWCETSGAVTSANDLGFPTYFDHIETSGNQLSNINEYCQNLNLHNTVQYGQFYIDATTLYNSLDEGGNYTISYSSPLYVYADSAMTQILGVILQANHPEVTMYVGWSENGITKNYDDIILYHNRQRCQFVPYGGITKKISIIGQLSLSSNVKILCFGLPIFSSLPDGYVSKSGYIMTQPYSSEATPAYPVLKTIVYGPDYISSN